MITATKEFLTELDAHCEQRKNEILSAKDELEIKGTVYYVSASGNDENDGLTPSTAWKTLAKVSEAKETLRRGDGVLFRRGDLFRGTVQTAPGVTYAAYGSGAKPKFYAADRALDDPELWTEVDKEHHIWKWSEKILDVGTVVFNDGEKHSYKLIPSYIGDRFVCRNDESKPFDMATEMERDLDVYWHFDELLTTKPSRGQDFPVPDMKSVSYGELYLRCDAGNPAEVFDSVEAVARRHMFAVGKNDNVRIDNLCIKYVGQHGISAGGERVRGLHVSNCELGWIGGTIQNYLGVDPNYPEGGRGTVTRYGNAIEVYGGCDDYTVENCYIYQCYDAGITHQVTTHGKFREMTNVLYKDNLVEYCVYSIEYFLEKNEGDTESYMNGIEMYGNILRHAGEGWGQQRHNKHTPAHIKGWSYINTASNYTVHHNVFDRSAYRMLHLVAEKGESCPVMHDNVYIQYRDGMIGQYGGNETKEPDILYFDENADKTVETVFGDKDAKLYVIG